MCVRPIGVAAIAVVAVVSAVALTVTDAAIAERDSHGRVGFITYKPCTGQSIVVRPQPNGSLARTVLPRTFTSPTLAAVGDRLRLAWSSRGSVFSSELNGGTVGAPTPEGPADKSSTVDLLGVPGGGNWLVWGAPDGIRARFSDSAGETGPSVLVAAGDEFFPTPLALTRDGSIWIGLSELSDTDAAYARRISPAGQATPLIQIFRSRYQLARVFLEPGLSDGHDGFIAAVDADDDFSSEMDPSGQVGFSSTLHAVQVDADGRASQRVAADVDGDLWLAGLANSKTAAQLIYQRARRGSPVVLRVLKPGPSLGRTHRLRIDGRVDAFAASPDTGNLAVLARTGSGSRARLSLLRFDRRGRRTRSVTVARRNASTGDRIEFGPAGRTYVAWRRRRSTGGSEAFVRMVGRGRASGSRKVWACPRR